MRKVLYILGHLSDQDIEWMSAIGRVGRLADGETLIREDAETRDIFIILNGLAEVRAAGIGVLALLRTGEIVGEMAFVEQALPSADVRAIGALEFLAIEKWRLQDRLDSDPGFSGRFYKALAVFLSDRLRKANALIKNGGRLDVGADSEGRPQLDEAVLDQVSLAGAKFQRMLAILQGAVRP